MKKFFLRLYESLNIPDGYVWLTPGSVAGMFILAVAILISAVWMIRDYVADSLILKPVVFWREDGWAWASTIEASSLTDAGLFLVLMVVFLKLWEIGSRYIEAQKYLLLMFFLATVIGLFRVWGKEVELFMYLPTTCAIAALFSLIVRKSIKESMRYWVPNVPVNHLKVLIELNQILKEITSGAEPIAKTTYMNPLTMSLFCFISFCVGDSLCLLLSQGGIVAVISLGFLICGAIMAYHIEKLRLIAFRKARHIYRRKYPVTTKI